MNNTYTEFEAKFYPVDKEKYRKKLRTIGAKLIISERKMIRVVADKRANPLLSENNCIRVRDEGNLVRLSLKISAEETGKISDQKEIEVEVSDFEKTVNILKVAGIKFNRRQETLREEWEYKGQQITIDSWPGLEPFSEIEADSAEKVKEIAEKLGFSWNEKIVTPAVEVYARVYRMKIDEVLKRISNLSFKKDPFKGLKKYDLVYN